MDSAFKIIYDNLGFIENILSAFNWTEPLQQKAINIQAATPSVFSLIKYGISFLFFYHFKASSLRLFSRLLLKYFTHISMALSAIKRRSKNSSIVAPDVCLFTEVAQNNLCTHFANKSIM